MRLFVITVILCMFAASLATAQEGRPPRLLIEPYGSSYDTDNFTSSATGLDITSNTFTKGGSMVQVKLNGFHRHTTDNDTIIPEDLYDFGIFLGSFRNDRHLILSVSSPSDKPFDSTDELQGFAAAAWKVGGTAPHSFMAGVAASNSMIFGFTHFFPYISYEYKTDTVSLSFPAPARFIWHFARQFSYTLSYHFNGDAFTSVAWNPKPGTTFAVEASQSAEEYLIADRENTDDHLFLRSTRAGLRLTQSISPTLILDVFGGYSFDASYYVSDSVYDDDDGVDIEDTPRRFRRPHRPILMFRS